MNSSMYLPLLLIGALFAALVGGMLYWDSRFLKISHRVKSKKSVEEFSLDSAILLLTKTDLYRVKGIMGTDSWKKKLKLTVTYTTPAGKSTYARSIVYNQKDLPRAVARLDGLFGEWCEKLEKLNSLYAEELASGKELDDSDPKIYCYRIHGSSEHQGLVKVGSAKGSALKRIKDQVKTAAHISVDFEVLFIMPAVTISGETFMDHKVHRLLKSSGVANPMGEWFACSPVVAAQAVKAVQRNKKE